MKTHFSICPITGLSTSFTDSYNSCTLWPVVHPCTIEPYKLYRLIETKGTSLPKDYIAAGILLRLTNLKLIDKTKNEPNYNRGAINSKLSELHYFHLIELYWELRNFCGSSYSHLITLNLATVATQHPSVIHGLILSAAKQHIQEAYEAADSSWICNRHKAKEEKARLQTNKMDIKSVSKRTSKLMRSLYNTLPAPSISEQAANKTAQYLGWDDTDKAPRFLSINQGIRDRMVIAITTLKSEAIKEELLVVDGAEDKSFTMILKYLTGELKDSSLGLDWSLEESLV